MPTLGRKSQCSSAGAGSLRWVILLWAAACGESPHGPALRPAAAVSVVLSAENAFVGDTVRAIADARDSNDEPTTRRVVWRSTDPTVAQVDTAGVVVARAPGVTRIEATVDGKTADAALRVARADIGLAFPPRDTLIPDRGRLSVNVTSTFEIAAVTVRAADREFSLARGADPACPNCYSAILSLGGLPAGPIDIAVSATDVRGTSRVTHIRLTHDNPPVLRIVDPIELTVGRPKIHVRAICADDTGPCTYLQVSYQWDEAHALYQTASSPLDATVTLSASGLIRFTGVDRAGQSTKLDRLVFMDTTRQLVEWVTVPFGALRDVLGDRFLFIRDSLIQGNAQHIADSLWEQRVGGTSRLLFTGTQFLSPRLTEHGVILDDRTGGRQRIIEVRDGVTITRAESNAGGLRGPAVRGTWAAWGGSGQVVREDLRTGDLTTFAQSPSFLTQIVVGGNGDLAWYNDTELHWFHAGVEQTRAQPLGFQYWSAHTDAGLLAYNVGTRSGRGAGVIVDGAEEDSVPDRSVVAVENGWIGFSALNAAGVRHIYTRSPDGAVRVVDPFNGTAGLEALAGDGTVVLDAGNRRWITAPPYSSITDIGAVQGTIVVRDGRPLLLLGRSAFRIEP